MVATLVKVVRCGISPLTKPPTRPFLMSSAVVPPISGVNTSFDSPKGPWQEAHFSSNSSWPRSTLHTPLGRAWSRTDLENLDIGDLPAFDDLPGLDRVVVIDRLGVAHLAQLAVGRLHVTGLVDGARLQNGRLAVPHPTDVEAGQRLVLHRPFNPGGLPVDAAVEGNVDLLEPAAPRPGQAGNVVEARGEQGLAPGGGGADRLALLDRGVLAMQAIRH